MTEDMLQDRIALARQQGIRWLRIVQPLTCEDPWLLLPGIRDTGLRVMAWSAPTPGDCFVAAGIADEVRLAGNTRFDTAGQWWSTISDSLIEIDGVTGEATQSGAPGCLAGFAFSSDSQRNPHWKVWGDGALCLPEIIVWRHGAETVAVVTIDLDGDQPLSVLADLQGQLEAWLTAAPTQLPFSGPANGQVCSEQMGTDAWEVWRTRVEDARDSMEAGTMQKVVLARAQAYRPDAAQSFDPLATAWALRERQTNSTTFLVQRRDGQSFLGATPEILVRLQDQAVETVALAGTRKRGGASNDDAALGEDLLDSAKDRHEQNLVVQAIHDALAPIVAGFEDASEPEVVRLPDVQHLRTSIHARLTEEADIFDLLDRLHPTPAVGGLPRERALRWLDDNEHLDRGWYAGPIGWVDPTGNGEFVVAIRSVLMADDEAEAFAGCGLVAHSNPREEWEESQVKLQTVRQGLAFQGGPDS